MNNSEIDCRFIKYLPTELWQLIVSFLTIAEVCMLSSCCKYFNDDVVWGKYAGALLWREMGLGYLSDSIVLHRMIFHISYSKLFPPPVRHVRVLLQSNVDVNERDALGRTAMFFAPNSDSIELIRLLLDNKADPNISPILGIVALRCERVEIVAMLMRAGASANINYGITPLMNACDNEHFDIIRLLLSSNDIDVNDMDYNGYTALMRACRDGAVDVAKMLLSDVRVNTELRSRRTGKTALEIAVSHNRHDIMEEVFGLEPQRRITRARAKIHAAQN